MTRFFDCHCEIGPRNDKDPAAPWSAKDVLRCMDHCGIDGALVMHTLAITDDPIAARRALAREIARAPKRLFPAWAILPPDACDGELAPEELLPALKKNNIRAVKLFPKAHNWPFALPVIGATLAALEQGRILTMINFGELPDGNAAGPHAGAFKALHEVLSAFPKLPLLLQNAWWSAQRTVTALMARHENLHIEFSTYQINRGIETYSQRFGADRLIFGSGLPSMSAGAARAYVDYAQVSAAVKAKIAGGNLSRLLGGATPAAAPVRKPDPLRDRAATGKSLRLATLWDAHCHVLREDGNSAGSTVMYRGDADGLVELKDVMGVQKTALMSWVGPISSDPIEGNDVVARALKKHPGRFFGVAYLGVTHLDTRALMADLRKRVEKQGFVGLKPYPRCGLKYDHPLYTPCWEYAERHGLYSLLHLGGAAGGMDVVGRLAKQYPHAQWVIAHTGGSFNMARQVAAGMKENPNIWAELTLTPVTNGVIEWMAGEVGDDRILFGTDSPMRDPRPQLGWVLWSDLSLASRRRILGENYKRLLGMRR